MPPRDNPAVNCREPAGLRVQSVREPVTQILFASVFNTKSNFNRESLRIKGMPPKEWLAQIRQPQK